MKDLDFKFMVLGEGKPILFSHGLGASMPQPIKLLEGIKGIQLVSMDFPGHGLSSYPKDGRNPSFEFYAEELIKLMDALKIESATLGGISMGAGISLTVASKYPERVKSLILVRPAWMLESNPKNLGILIEAAEWIPKDFGRAKFEKLESFQRVKSKLPNAAMSLLGLFDKGQRKSLPKVLWHMVNDHPTIDYEKINAFEIPVLIIGNDNDSLHPFDMARNTSLLLEFSKLHKVTSRYIDDKKHKKEVQKLIQKFLK